jgi:hypothetical protein
VHVSVINIFTFKVFEQYSKNSIDPVFMRSLNHTSHERKRVGYANQNLINQIELNPQINENNPKYKNMRPKSKIAMKKNSPMRKGLLYHPT